MTDPPIYSDGDVDDGHQYSAASRQQSIGKTENTLQNFRVNDWSREYQNLFSTSGYPQSPY